MCECVDFYSIFLPRCEYQYSCLPFCHIFILPVFCSQGVNAMDVRDVSVKIPLSEVPFVMRAMGFYPSEQEVRLPVIEIRLHIAE